MMFLFLRTTTYSFINKKYPPDVEAPKLPVPFPDRAPLVTVTTGIAVIVTITAVLLAVYINVACITIRCCT
jgi:hypothetical protein